MQAFWWIAFTTVLWTLASCQDDTPNPDVENYRYSYFVRDEKTGDVKSHEETKIGDTVSGQYSLGDPNGDLRVVKYTADEGGFKADVKYEEGASPISEVEGRETSAKSGYEFQWLPANPDEAGAASKSTSDEISGGSTESPGDSAVNEGGSSEEKSIGEDVPSTPDVGQDTPSVEQETLTVEQETSSGEKETISAEQETTSAEQESISAEHEGSSIGQEPTSEQSTPSFGQSTASSEQDVSGSMQDGQDVSGSNPESKENSSDKNLSDEVISQEESGSPEAKPSNEGSLEASQEESKSDLSALDFGGLGDEASKEESVSKSESEVKETTEVDRESFGESEEIFLTGPEEVQGSESAKDSGSEEPKETVSGESQESESSEKLDSEPKNESEPASESKEESAETAESAPETAATEPSQMYLPVLPYQNLPFLNFPLSMGTPQVESNSPTIIYASQNFYNPWQWFGARRQVREETMEEQPVPIEGNLPPYTSGLGYILMPRSQQYR